jgi:hypothetical protein
MPLGSSSLSDLARGIITDAPVAQPIDSVQAMTLTPEGRLRVSSVSGYNDQIWSAIVAAKNPFVQSRNPWSDELPNPATAERPHAGVLR